MKLVLIRHGQAEHAFSKKDYDRELTEDGKRDVRHKSAQLAENLKNEFLTQEVPAFCLTSAASRAKQTADILLEELSERLPIDISCEEFQDFYYGDQASIIDRVAELPDNSIILIVGHQPTLSYFAAEICHIVVPFHTGDMACFELTDRNNFKGNLLWRISDF